MSCENDVVLNGSTNEADDASVRTSDERTD